MRVLFISAQATDRASAYQHRLDSLAEALAGAGATTDKLRLDVGRRSLGRGMLRHLSVIGARLPWGDWDYFHVGGSIVPGMLSLRPGRGAGIIYDAHGLVHAERQMKQSPGLGDRVRIPLLWASSVLSARRADLCVTMSKPMFDQLVRWRGGSDGVFIVRNGVDVRLFSPGPRPEKGGPFTVCYAGAFQPWQAVDLLEEAAASLSSRSDVLFRVVGFRPQDGEIKARLATRMPGAELIDRVGRSALVDLLRSSDLLVLPRRPHAATSVAMPTKFAEYLALGRPVLTNPVDETADLVRRIGCGFVADSNGDDMARAIELAASVPPEELEQMGARGRAFAEEELVWEGIGQRYLAFLRAQG